MIGLVCVVCFMAILFGAIVYKFVLIVSFSRGWCCTRLQQWSWPGAGHGETQGEEVCQLYTLLLLAAWHATYT